MSIPIGAGVRERFDDRCGLTVKGPRRASRGMVWVRWDGAPSAQLWERFRVVYVARHYEMMKKWDAAHREPA